MYESVRTISFDKQPRRIKQPSALTTLTITSVEHAGVSAEKSEDDTMVFSRLTQTRQMVCHLTGTAQKHGQTLVSAIVANPQAGASGVAYHLTVPPRYLELSMLRQGMNIRGKFGEVALATRDV